MGGDLGLLWKVALCREASLRLALPPKVCLGGSRTAVPWAPAGLLGRCWVRVAAAGVVNRRWNTGLLGAGGREGEKCLVGEGSATLQMCSSCAERHRGAGRCSAV